MRALIQRVSEARVVIGGEVHGEVHGEIGAGLLVLLGVHKDDTGATAEKLARKVLNYRVFPDGKGLMNLSLLDAGGELLVVSQFTLAASTTRGLRPSFLPAAEPAVAEQLYNKFVEVAAGKVTVATGSFGADMKVGLVNDGPVTCLLEA